MQNRFSVAIGLFPPFEHKVASRLKGDGLVEIRRHRTIERIAGVLPVHHRRHALHRFHHLLFACDAMMQPVCHVLSGNAQCRAVFHETDIVDVRHFGAADA